MRRNRAAFLFIEDSVEHEIDGEQAQSHKGRLGQQVGHGPEEINALQVAQEKRRVSQGCKGAADIGNKEDKEDNLVHTVFAVGIGSKQRADEQHGSTRCSHPAGQQCPHCQKAGIYCGRADQGSFQAHAACHSEQREEQDDKRNIVKQDGMGRLKEGSFHAIDDGAGNQKGHSPENGYLAEVIFPEMSKKKRSQGDAKEHAHKGDHPDNTQFLPRDMRQVLCSQHA